LAPTTQPPPPAFAITINSDAGGATTTQFDPSEARVYVNTVVRWINHDSVPRSVAADNHAFASSLLPPGGVFEYHALTPGTFNYHDGTRPYAVGVLQVVGR
jgi:plastocyanin